MLTRFLNKTPAEINALTHRWESFLREHIWNAKPRNTKAEIEEFYRNMPVEYLCKIDTVARIDVKQYLKDLNAKGDRVLDFGCGTGEYGLRLAREAKEVHFVDLPNIAQDFLKWRIKDRNLKNCKVLPAPEGEYDVIICCDVLEHVQNPTETLKMLAGHLRRFGKLVLSTPLILPMYFQNHDINSIVDMEHIKEAVDDWKRNNTSQWILKNFIKDKSWFVKTDITFYLIYNYNEGTTGDFIERALRKYARVITNRDLPIRPNGEGLRTVVERERIKYVMQIDSGGWIPMPLDIPAVKIAYSIDTFNNTERVKAALRNYDFKFYAQKKYAIGTGEHWLSLGADTDVYKARATQQVYDVAFCGTFLARKSQAERNRCLKALVNEAMKDKLSLYIGRDYNEQASLRYNQAWLVFNRGIADDVNMRFFEAMASQTPQLYNEVDGLKELGFEADKHYFAYKDETDIVARVYEILNQENIKDNPNKDIYKRVMNMAYKTVIHNHTYEHRVLQMIRILEGGK